jgi:hypothetical protein
MARPKPNGQLEAAVATLINNQAQFMGAVQRIYDRLANIEAILLRHEQMLQSMPEAIRQKVGFKNR